MPGHTSSELRRRHTKESYAVMSKRKLVKQRFFSGREFEADEVPREFEDFLEELRSRISESTPEREILINNITRVLKQHRLEILELIENNPALIIELRERLQQPKSSVLKEDQYSIYSYLKHLTKSLVLSQISSFHTGLGFTIAFLSSFGAAAASGLGFSSVTDIPSGGEDLCAGKNGYLMSCIQGWLEYGVEPGWTITSQYNTVIEQAGKHADMMTYLRLKDCVDLSTVGEPLAKLLPLALTSNSSKITCSASLPAWSGFKMSAEATGIPEAICPSLKDGMTAAMEKCQIDVSSESLDWVIPVSVLGGVTLLAVLAVATYKLCKSESCSSKCRV